MTMSRRILVMAILVLLTTTSCDAEESYITVEGASGVVHRLELLADQDTVSILRIEPKIVAIGGSGLQDIKRLQISFSDLRDLEFSYLDAMSSLEVIEMSFVSLSDLDWIGFAPSLKAVSIAETVSLSEGALSLDLKRNQRLEFLEIHGAHLSTWPVIESPPNSLRAISLYSSRFDVIDENAVIELDSKLSDDANIIVSRDAYQRLMHLDLSSVTMDTDLLRSLYQHYGL